MNKPDHNCNHYGATEPPWKYQGRKIPTKRQAYEWEERSTKTTVQEEATNEINA